MMKRKLSIISCAFVAAFAVAESASAGPGASMSRSLSRGASSVGSSAGSRMSVRVAQSAQPSRITSQAYTSASSYRPPVVNLTAPSAAGGQTARMTQVRANPVFRQTVASRAPAKPIITAKPPPMKPEPVGHRYISTAKNHESAMARTQLESRVMRSVSKSPTRGYKAKPLPGFNNDPRFRASNGWQKWQKQGVAGPGQKATVHYQYRALTNQVADIKGKNKLRAVIPVQKTVLPPIKPGATVKF